MNPPLFFLGLAAFSPFALATPALVVIPALSTIAWMAARLDGIGFGVQHAKLKKQVEAAIANA